MSNRELAIGIVNSMSEEKLLAFIKLFSDENLIARLETEKLINDAENKHYDSFAEIEEEIFKNE